MSFLPAVTRAEHRGGYHIYVEFNDKTAKTVDFGPWLEGPVFEPLKDVGYFKRFFLDGGTIAWPNGADIAPEMLYEYRGPADSPRSHRQPSGTRRESATSQPGARRRG